MFNPAGLDVVVQSLSGGLFRLFSYATTDSRATVLESGYFTNAASYGLKLESLIVVLGEAGSETESYLVRVTSIDPTGDATVVVDADLDTVEEELLDAIASETAARIAADTTLQTNIDDEETARTSADTTLQGNIDAEETARAAADTTLQSNIDTEEAARIAADTTLQTNLDTEEAARIAADTTLQTNIDTEESARIAGDALKTNAAVVPNTAPSAGQLLLGNAGGTAYAPKTMSGAVTIDEDGETTLSAITADGTTTARTLPIRFAEEINLKDMGAVGDGTTDDSTAFAAAIATGKPIFAPPGTYLINTGASATLKRVAIRGVRNQTFFVYKGTGTFLTVDNSGTNGAFFEVVLQDFQLFPQAASQSACAFDISFPSTITAYNRCQLLVREVQVISASTANSFKTCFKLTDTWQVHFSHVIWAAEPTDGLTDGSAFVEVDGGDYGNIAMKWANVVCYYGNYALLAGAYTEGFFATNCDLVGQTVAINVPSGTAVGGAGGVYRGQGFVFNNCEIAAWSKCIDLDTVQSLWASNCNFVQQGGSSDSNFRSIKLTSCVGTRIGQMVSASANGSGAGVGVEIVGGGGHHIEFVGENLASQFTVDGTSSDNWIQNFGRYTNQDTYTNSSTTTQLHRMANDGSQRFGTSGQCAIMPDGTITTPHQAGYQSSVYYFGEMANPPGVATQAFGANILYFVPFFVRARTTFTKIGFNVSSAVAGNARLGIYYYSSGKPDVLLLDAGTVSTSSTGDKEITISQTLSPGLYSLVILLDATPTLLSTSFAASAGGLFGQGTVGTPTQQLFATFTYAALPATLTFGSGGIGAYTRANGSNITPALWLRV